MSSFGYIPHPKVTPSQLPIDQSEIYAQLARCADNDRLQDIYNQQVHLRDHAPTMDAKHQAMANLKKLEEGYEKRYSQKALVQFMAEASIVAKEAGGEFGSQRPVVQRFE